MSIVQTYPDNVTMIDFDGYTILRIAAKPEINAVDLAFIDVQGLANGPHGIDRYADEELAKRPLCVMRFGNMRSALIFQSVINDLISGYYRMQEDGKYISLIEEDQGALIKDTVDELVPIIELLEESPLGPYGEKARDKLNALLLDLERSSSQVKYVRKTSNENKDG